MSSISLLKNPSSLANYLRQSAPSAVSRLKTLRQPSIQSGFTLLEMVLVLFLLGLLATAGLLLTEGIEDQAKYDETKRRMELIRKAIVGDPTRTVNGGPEISGFAADMGRLPGCLAELLVLGEEKTPVTSPRTFKSPCDDNVTVSEWHVDENTGLWFGWRGPYIQVMPERGGKLRFRDGYGNVATDDEQNSGWEFESDASAVRVKSVGADGLANTVDDYPSDNPLVDIDPIVFERDFLVDISNWSGRVLFRNTSAASAVPMISTSLMVRLYYPDVDPDTGETIVADVDSEPFLISENAVPVGESRFSEPVSFGNDLPKIPWGQRRAELLCEANEANFNGDCAEANPDTYRTVTLLPYAQATDFHFIWDIE